MWHLICAKHYSKHSANVDSSSSMLIFLCSHSTILGTRMPSLSQTGNIGASGHHRPPAPHCHPAQLVTCSLQGVLLGPCPDGMQMGTWPLDLFSFACIDLAHLLLSSGLPAWMSVPLRHTCRRRVSLHGFSSQWQGRLVFQDFQSNFSPSSPLLLRLIPLYWLTPF